LEPKARQYLQGFRLDLWRLELRYPTHEPLCPKTPDIDAVWHHFYKVHKSGKPAFFKNRVTPLELTLTFPLSTYDKILEYLAQLPMEENTFKPSSSLTRDIEGFSPEENLGKMWGKHPLFPSLSLGFL
jgi:hypothetical protein